MKRRYRNLLNLFAISLLLVALYLNFVEKEVADFSSQAAKARTTNPVNTNNNKSGTLSAKQPEPTIVLK